MNFQFITKTLQINGQPHEFYILPHPGAVVILAEEDGRVPLVRQYRPAADEHLWELPAGTLELGEDPADAAPRELSEETGLAAREWTYLGRFFAAPGYATEELHLYLARGLTRGEQHLDEGEEIDEVRWFSMDELRDLVRQDEIRDAKTLAGLYHFELFALAR